LEVDLPRGVEEGERVVLSGEGDYVAGQGPTDVRPKPPLRCPAFASVKSERAGCVAQVVFVARVKEHEVFQRHGSHLLLKQTVSLAEALGGLQLLLSQLDGRKLLVKSGAGECISPGSLRVIEGEGMPRRDGTTGNLLIQFDVEFPASGTLGEEERAALLAMLSPTGDAPGVRVPDSASQQEREESWDVGDADECLLEEVDLGTEEYQERRGQERDEGFRGFRWAM